MAITRRPLNPVPTPAPLDTRLLLKRQEQLKRFYHFDDPSGGGCPEGVDATTIAESWLCSRGFSGTKLLGDKYNGDLRDAEPARAVLFDGTDDYVRASISSASWTPAYPMTLCGWVRHVSLATTPKCFISLVDPAASNEYLSIRVLTTGGVYVSRSNSGGSNNTTVLAGGSITTGVWNHMAAVLSDPTTVLFYLNGQLVYSTPVASLAIDSSYSELLIGVLRLVSPTDYHDGQAKDVRLYNAALTAAQISTIYNTTKDTGGNPLQGLFPANLVGHWLLEDGENKQNSDYGIALDSSGNNNHGGAVNISTAFDDQGTATPYSMQNERGYSDQPSIDPSWTLLIDETYVDNPGGWNPAGTDGKAAALFDQLWRGVTAPLAAKFLNGALGGGANNQCSAAASAATLTIPANKLCVGVWEIALSRPLATGERIDVRFSPTSFAVYMLPSTGGSDYVNSDRTQWTVYTGETDIRATSTSPVDLVVLPYNAVTAGDITVFIKSFRIYDTGKTATDTGPLDVRMWPDRVPQKASVPSTDIHANALTHVGPASYNALLKDSMCADFDGTDDTGSAPGNAAYPSGSAARTVTGWLYWDTTIPAVDGFWSLSASAVTGERFNFGYSTPDTGIGMAFTGVRMEIPGFLPYQRWFHYAIRVPNGATTCGEVEMYIDGEKMPTAITAGSGATALTTLANQPVGVVQSGNAKCKQSDLRLYDVALTEAEIRGLYNGTEPATAPVGHWPLAEGAGTTAYDVAPLANHMTLSNITESLFWSRSEPRVHRNIKKGFRVANATGTSRTFNGTNQYFSIASNSDLQGADQYLWVAAWITPTSVTGTRAFVTKRNIGTGQEEYFLYTTGTDLRFRVSNDGTTGSSDATAVSALAIGVPVFVVAYHDPAANALGISINGGSFTTASHTTGIFSGTSTFAIGAWLSSGSPTSFAAGDIGFAAMGKTASAITWATLRDALYNGGVIPTYGQMAPADLTSWGVKGWWDMDDVEPFCRDKRGTNHCTGFGMPRIPARNNSSVAADAGVLNAPAGRFHNGAETAIDFTNGGVVVNVFGTTPDNNYRFGTTPTVVGRRRRKLNSINGYIEDQFYALK